jgi:dipeptidyl aminopeptidase/acylaminoacyl peptidase
MWILNTQTIDEALKKLEDFRLDGVVQQMRCPFLLTHGEEDKQVPVKDARALFDAVGSQDKTFKLFSTEEGGSQHCQRDNVSLGITFICDWLQEKLGDEGERQ